MAESLYRKYRSLSFSEVVGQDHITQTLKNSVDNKTFSHAYLLTGLRGVGKTSVARIFANYVNEIQPNETNNYVDIIEIDAASNRKIDEIRDLRQKVIIAPSSLKYKVYIIDEVHMLTKEAFNALLKTLEEPPKHCIFILATTDYHKLPDTIISRCIRFSFKSIPADLIVKHLKMIAKKENISIDAAALNLIAENSSSSLRDALTTLDQARNLTNKITNAEIELLLGIVNRNHISNLYEAVSGADYKKVLEHLETIYESGAISEQVIRQFIAYLRDTVSNSKLDNDERRYLLDLIKQLISVVDYSDQKLAFEVCLFKYCLNNSPINSAESKEVKKSIVAHVPTEAQKPIIASVEKEINETSVASNAPTDTWRQVLAELKKTNSTLYGIARMAEATEIDNKLVLKLKFSFHKKQLDLKKNKDVIIDLVKNKNNVIDTIEIILIEEQDPSEKVVSQDDSKDIANVSNIFGSAEVLES